MGTNKTRSSNLELLRILCILFIIGDHFFSQSGVIERISYGTDFLYCALTSLSRVGCSVFVIISSWFSVGKEFKFKKVLHVWLTVIMYSFPLTLFLFVNGYVKNNDLANTLFPIEQSPLWFASFYIVLVILMPCLNFIITNASRKTLEILLLFAFFALTLYTTLTTSAGLFSSDLWVFIFLYLLTGYIKYYELKIPSSWKCFLIFGILWVLITIGRTVSYQQNLSTIAYYMDAYRAKMQTLPNLIMAYSLFFGFLGLKLKPSAAINKVATATLGIYCFHQVPCWYSYLWNNIFLIRYHSLNLNLSGKILYSLVSVAVVFIGGMLIEFIRSGLSALLIEDRAYCSGICSVVDSVVNNGQRINSRDIKALSPLIVFLTVYIILIKIFSAGCFDPIIFKDAESARSDISSSIDIDLNCRDFSYANGCVNGYLLITNNGNTIKDMSNGTHAINIGVSILDKDGNMIDTDFMRITTGLQNFFSESTIRIPVNIEEAEGFDVENCIIRFEVVHEGYTWIPSTETRWEYSE